MRRDPNERPTQPASMAADVPSFLAEHELSQYAAAFEENGWDSIAALRDISDADLEVRAADAPPICAINVQLSSRLRRQRGFACSRCMRTIVVSLYACAAYSEAAIHRIIQLYDIIHLRYIVPRPIQ